MMSEGLWWPGMGLILAGLCVALVSWRNRTGLRILVWHAVAPGGGDRQTTSLAAFERQLQWLRRRGYAVIPFSEVLRRHAEGDSLPPRTVVLTFDDACSSFRRYALPGLEAAGLPSVVMVPVAAVENQTDPLRHDKGGRMCLNALRELPRSVEIGLHSYDHFDYSRANAAHVRADIARCARLRLWLGDRVIPVFAYPFGRVPRSGRAFALMEGQLRVVGMSLGLRLGYGVNPWPLRDEFRVRRICIHGTDSFFRFVVKLTLGRIRL